MTRKTIQHLIAIFTFLLVNLGTDAQKKKASKERSLFSWNNPPTKSIPLPANVKHATFKSRSMRIKVGYYIYLPPEYNSLKNKSRKYPIVYHLHGGRPGNEKKSISLANFVHQAVKKGQIQPTIYVFPNGGPMSWYNYPQKENALAEDIFIQELLPHIDTTYRTYGTRAKRGIEGFSQGGRGVSRIMFKHAKLFCSVAPGGSGYEPEERIRDNDGKESEKVHFAKGYDAWSLAQKYAKQKNAHSLEPMIWVGTKGFNYDYNLKYMKFLDELGIPYKKLVVPDAPHSAKMIYEKQGLKLMQYHQRNFRK